jgi:hypothetical protein
MPPKYKDPDPLALDGLDPLHIDAAVEAKKQKPVKPPTEHEMKKEERLAQKEARLAGASQGGPSSAPPPPEVSLTLEEKTKLLDKLAAYKERFPHLKTRNKTIKTAEDILDELHYVEVQLGSQAKQGGFGTTLLYGSMCGLEYSTGIWNPLNLNLAGLGAVTKQNMADFEPIVDELMIKYGGAAYMPPEYRLALAVGAMVFTVHTANSGDPALAQAMSKMHATVKKPPQADGL